MYRSFEYRSHVCLVFEAMVGLVGWVFGWWVDGGSCLWRCFQCVSCRCCLLFI